MGKERFVPIFAMSILLIGIFSAVYVYATQVDTDVITIDGKAYTIDQIFSITEPRTFESLNFSGVALDDLIMKTYAGCSACHKYTITGEDGYQKTVTWDNMKNGLLTKDGRVVFSDLPKAFGVRNVLKIEVI